MRATTVCLAVGSVVIAGFVACGGSQPPPAPASSAPPSADNSQPAEVTPPEAAETAPGEPAADEPEKPAEQPDVPPEGATVDRIMQAHFKDALLIREAVIDGRPEDAVDPAYVIANIQDLDKLPAGWQSFVEHMQATARRLSNSTTAAAAAGAAADLGVSCGLCHQRHGGPKVSTEPPPPKGDTMESRMQHHVWATERLWEGLAIPSSEAWNKGANALSTEPFPAQLLKEGGVDVRSAAKDFEKLVAKAPAKKTAQERAGLYAELLVTCGTCHAAMAGKE